MVRAFDSGLATPVLLCAMGAALWFASHHWHEQAWTLVGMACIAALSIADLRRHRRQAHAQRLLQSIQEAVPDILFFKDTHLRYRAINRAFSETFSLAPVHVLGQDDRALFGEAVHARVAAQDRALLASGEAGTFEEHLEIGGQVRLLRARRQPVFDARGRAIGIVGLSIDVTEERRLQRRLADKVEEARAATVAKGQFLAMMSHEIRTPMNGVLGMLDLLFDTALDADQHVLLARCRESSVALLAILNDILDFSKIEAGKLSLERKPVALRALAAEASAMLAPEATRRRVVVRVHVDAAVPAEVTGDAVRLRQVLVNLVGNAVKFTQDGHVDVVIDFDDDRVRLRVRDTGIGIAPAALAGLFQPFAQADVATTRRFGGTGLGLSIVKRLVDLMAGDVACESTPGEGSCFTVRLPLPAWQPEATHAASTDDADVGAPTALALPRGLHVLLAEDHPINREVIVRQLAKLGWTCECAEDGEIAWTHLADPAQAARFAMLITDCHMPNLDGYALVERLRAHEAAQHRPRLPVVALTANALQGERERCLALGMEGYLAKPLQVRELQATLAGLLPATDAPYAFLREVCSGALAGVVELLRTAVAPGEADLDALDDAVAARDAPRVRALAHRLASVARQLDERHAGDALALLEDAATRAAPMDRAHARAAQALRDALARAQAFIALHAGAT